MYTICKKLITPTKEYVVFVFLANLRQNFAFVFFLFGLQLWTQTEHNLNAVNFEKIFNNSWKIATPYVNQSVSKIWQEAKNQFTVSFINCSSFSTFKKKKKLYLLLSFYIKDCLQYKKKSDSFWRTSALQQLHLLHDYHKIINRSTQILFNFAQSTSMDSCKVKFKKILDKHVYFAIWFRVCFDHFYSKK